MSTSTRPLRKKPETIRFGKTSPSFTVNDLQASIAWYRDVLGIVVGEEWHHEGRLVGASMKAGATHIMLGQDDFAKGRDRKKGVAMRIYCQTTQDVDQLAKDIKNRGGKLAHEPQDQPWGVREFSVQDPDGFLITIFRDK